MRSIEYPNKVADLVVVEMRSPDSVGFMVRPIAPGNYRLLVWPDRFPDPDLSTHIFLKFSSPDGPPAHAVLSPARLPRLFRLWRWALLPTSELSSPLEDLAQAAFGVGSIARGSFQVYGKPHSEEARCVAWSCHQPYGREAEPVTLVPGIEDVLEWYAAEIRKFRPHAIWGAGDTAYSDDSEATDFSGQVYDHGAWYRSPLTREWLRQSYRSMYRHFWSLAPMRGVMSEFPHLFMWDDHEIHDGWGSEGKDFERGNLEMFRIAKEVAEEYVLQAGPRVRPSGIEAHQAYVMGPMAAFIFDTRSTRNYEAARDPLISRDQYQDFVAFLRLLRDRNDVTDLITCTTVPFVGLRTWVTSLATRAPDSLNDSVLRGVRDDVRDSWTSPGNIGTLSAVLFAMRSFMLERPDMRISNISGDIHVANAFEIHVPGAPRPIIQLTTSAITNRDHAPDWLRDEIEIGDHDFIEGVGEVRRIWNTVTDPNFLLMRIGSGRAEFTLKVWNRESPGSKDLFLLFSQN